MVSLRRASREDAAEMARIQSEAVARGAADLYTDEQLAHLAPSEPAAEAIPDAEFGKDSRYAVVAEEDGDVVGFYAALGYERRREIDAGGPDAPEIPGVEMTKDLA